MKICIFSDIHGNNYSFEKFVNEVRNKYDYYLFAGDVYGYYYGIGEVVNLLKKLKPLKMVLGNHDANYIEVYLGLDNTPFKKIYGEAYSIFSNELYELLIKQSDILELNLDGLNIAMIHGTLDNHLNGRDYPGKEKSYCNNYNEYDLVIQGHTHIKMLKRHGKTTIINPGSIGQSRNEDGVTYAIYNTQEKEVVFRKLVWDKEKLFKKISTIEPMNKKLIEVLERERER